ncbi:MAG: DUF885 domain-containing protein [Pseudomonadota bacterium]
MRKLLLITVFLLTPFTAIGAGTDDLARAMFDADWQWRLQNEPEYATMVGDYRFDAALSDTSMAAVRTALAYQRKVLEQARLIERSKLSPQNQLSLDLFIHDKEMLLRAASFHPFRYQPLSSQQGLHINFAQTVAQMPFATEVDYRNYLARLDALPAHIAGLIEQMREAIKTGWMPPKVVVAPVPAMLRQLRDNAVSGALGQPFRQIPSTIDKPARDAIALAGPALLRNRVMPALQELEDFMRAEYVPAARDTVGVGALPNGADYYAFLIARYTNARLSAADIHAMGLKEVARIRADMDKVVARTGFQGPFTRFAAFANTDQRLFYTSPEPMLARYRRIVARAQAGAPRLFSSVPAQTLLVKPAPVLGAETQGAAWYEAGAADRPAALIVNISRLDTRPMWEIETLALHEAVPGHHLQVARAQELADLPAFRRYGWNVAFGEGWALYAESLGPELGFFRDPFSAFGHLNAELFRAVRLVVDTGIHSQGWTRQQALDYMNANSANPGSDNEVEVDRYIAWPGQALGYKLGQLKIKALRERAQMTLGERFDLRRFHSAILDNGPLPLALLEQQVELWLGAAMRTSSAPPAAN